MNHNNGWVCLHRCLRDWEWYTDVNTCHLFIHLILSANHAPKKHRGVVIGKGQLKTGRVALSKETGLSEQQIRTSLKRLISTSEITIKKHNKYSIISITNWDRFQQKNKESTSEITSNQPATNQQLTTNNNVNNKNNVNNINNYFLSLKPDDVPTDIWESFCAMRKKRKAQITERVVQNIVNQAAKAGVQTGDAFQECIDRNWLTFKAEWHNNSKQQRGQNYDKHKNNQSTHANITSGIMLALDELNQQ